MDINELTDEEYSKLHEKMKQYSTWPKDFRLAIIDNFINSCAKNRNNDSDTHQVFTDIDRFKFYDIIVTGGSRTKQLPLQPLPCHMMATDTFIKYHRAYINDVSIFGKLT